MKNQYFGDRNDYFKFDLCIFLAENLPKIERFTFIPMLTADDASNDGLKISYPMRVGRESLYEFLQDALTRNHRKVVHLLEYFDRQKFRFKYYPYGDSLELEFTHADRDQYFGEIPVSTLQSAVILVDPDNGLEVKSSTAGTFHKYLKYSEAKQLYQRMDSDSVLVLYQHFPFIKRKVFLEGLHARIQDEVGCPALVTVADNNIALVMIAKNSAGRKRLRKATSQYLRRDLLFMG